MVQRPPSFHDKLRSSMSRLGDSEPKAPIETSMSRRFAAIAPAAFMLILLGALDVAAHQEKEPTWTASFGPNLPSFLTLASGHSYTVLQMGPVFGKEGKPLGWR